MIFNSIQFYIFRLLGDDMKKRNKEKLIIIIILIISIIAFDRLTLLLVRKGNSYGTDVLNFYKQPRNSIDLIVLGSSHAYTSFNPYLIEEETGLKTYDFCTQQQPLWITYYYLKEALKYQHPKYIVLESHMAVVGNYDYAEEQVNRDAIDKMRFSSNKVDTIKNSVENEEDRMSYYLNIIKYHSRYKEVDVVDIKTAFLGYTIDNKGYIALEETGYVFDNTNELTNNEIEIYKKNIEYLNKIINLAKEENIKLIIVKTPTSYGQEDMARLNYVKRVANENDILFLDYMNDMDDLNLDYSKDFYDAGHLNKNGSIKFTNKFTEIIKQM